jgi:tetratricopeptide (TPR) repeat protein
MKSFTNKILSILICLVLISAIIAVYYKVCTYDYINYDDLTYVFDNPNIQSGISLNTIKWMFTTNVGCNWHPLTWLSFMLDWQLFGSNAGGRHFTNLIFHIANTLLLFLVFKRMTSAIWQSAFVAALFALHPLHVESVAWVAERKDVLSTFFWLLTMSAYLRYVKRPGVGRYLLTLLVFVLGLMAKPMLVTLPFVLLLLDYWPLERIKHFNRQVIYHLIWEKIPFIVLSVIFSIITFFTQQSREAIVSVAEINLKIRLLNALISYVKYIEKMFWPSGLTFFYPHPYENISFIYAALSAVFLLVVTIFVIRTGRNHRYLVTGWFWYLGTLIPVIGLVQVGVHAWADRYSYITLTGLFIIIAWGIPELLEKWNYRKFAVWGTSLAVLFILAECAYFQQGYWKNSFTISQHALAVTKNNYMAQCLMADALFKQGNNEEAIRYYSEAIKLRPRYAYALNGLGNAFYKEERIDESIDYYKRAVEADPCQAKVYSNLAAALENKGRFDEAILLHKKALQISPDIVELRIKFGAALVRSGKLAEAVKEYEKILLIQPQNAIVHEYLGKVLFQQGQFKDAIAHLEESLRLKPNEAEYMNDLAWALTIKINSGVYNPGKAVRLAQQACELTNYKKPELLDTLAAAYAAAGDYDKAVETAEKALELCQSPKQEMMKEEIKSRLVLFKAGKPYIEQ